jgi:hypothetical protein
MLAQSLVEYGVLDRFLAAGQALMSNVDEWFLAVSPTTWLLLGVALVVVLRVWSRRR